MIKTFKVKNYRSIKDWATLSFEPDDTVTQHDDLYFVDVAPGIKLLRMAAIYGPNGAGKSNLLGALLFLKQISLTKQENKDSNLLNQVSPYLLAPTDELDLTEPTEFEIDFYFNGALFNYYLQLDQQRIYRENLTHQGEPVFNRYFDTENDKTHIDFGTNTNLKEVERQTLEINTVEYNSVLAVYSNLNIKSSLLHAARDFFKLCIAPPLMAGIPKDKFHDALNSAYVELILNQNLRKSLFRGMQIAGFDISDIKVKFINHNWVEQLINKGKTANSPDEKHKLFFQITQQEIETIIFFREYSERGIPLVAESHGTQRYFQLLAFLLHNYSKFPNRFFAIDELEAALHPDLQIHFLKTFLYSMPSAQMLFSTHSITLLESAIFRKDVIWFTENQPGKGTELFPLSDFENIPDNANLKKYYEEGVFGAKPFTGNPTLD